MGISGAAKYWRNGDLSEIEIFLSVVVGDIACDFTESSDIIREFVVFCKLAEQVAEYASEIFMTRVGEEAS